jgi:predicted ATP-dependent protease
VLIPASNVRHLILRSDVVKAVAEGKFHIYPVKSTDEGLAILTGMFADGSAENYVNKAVADRLKELALGLKEFTGGVKEAATEPIP